MRRRRYFIPAWTIPAAVALVLCIRPYDAAAADVTVNYGFGQPPGAAAIVAPKEVTKLATTPVFATVQTSTELDTTRQAAGTAEAAAEPGGQPRALPRAAIGIDTYFSDREKLYNIPLSYLFFSSLYAQLNIPVVSARYDAGGSTIDNTGLGDISLTLKHIFGSEEQVEVYSLLTTSFATGDEDKGLGSGAYVVSLTEKGVKRFGDYRCTLMAGVSVPVNEPTILGSKVKYSTSVSYMAAVERPLFLPNLWFGVRAAGVHTTETKIDGIGAGNSLTTLDVIPNIRFLAAGGTALQLAVFIPAYTDYDVPGASDRDVIINFGIVKSF